MSKSTTEYKSNGYFFVVNIVNYQKKRSNFTSFKFKTIDNPEVGSWTKRAICLSHFLKDSEIS